MIRGKMVWERVMTMEWLVGLRGAIDYMERHLLEDIGVQEAAEAVHISPFYFQRGFKIVTGYSVGEYLRSRRLYLAGLDVIKSGERIIELSSKYGYDTPESFTRAFTRFHGLSPRQLKAQPFRIRVFLPLSIEIVIKGGTGMEYVIEKMDAMKMIGIERTIPEGQGYQEAPAFWEEFRERYLASPEKMTGAEQEIYQAIADNMVGEFGICIDDDAEKGYFRYMIAGKYRGGRAPEGMKIVEIPACSWAKFRCVGPMPEAFQTVNTRIFKEWLPGNPQYELAAGINIEWYSEGDLSGDCYESGIWIPVRERTNER